MCVHVSPFATVCGGSGFVASAAVAAAVCELEVCVIEECAAFGAGHYVVGAGGLVVAGW